jgi:hypothetical protein
MFSKVKASPTPYDEREENCLFEQSARKDHSRGDKHSFYHAYLRPDGICRGYESHMRRGSAVRSVYGYLLAILQKYPNLLGYVYPSKRTIQTRTFKWRRWRSKWYKSNSNYSKRQIYRALKELERIGAIVPTGRGWFVKDHKMWTIKKGRICRICAIESTLTLPKKHPTQVAVLEVYCAERHRQATAKS